MQDVHRPLARITFVAAVLVSMVVLFVPAGGVPSAPPGIDAIVHALLFLALAVSGRWAGAGPRVLGPALVLYAAASEVVQGLAVIGRTSSMADWLADLGGLLVGLALGELVARRTR
jgi:VanZ family protein